MEDNEKLDLLEYFLHIFKEQAAHCGATVLGYRNHIKSVSFVLYFNLDTAESHRNITASLPGTGHMENDADFPKSWVNRAVMAQ